MSPIARRRWANFRANRRGWHALWIFAALFGASLLAEFIANDKPILLWMNGELHAPVIKPPTEQDLGGELPIEADYADPYVRALIESAGGWTVEPIIPYSYDTIDLYIESAAPAAPSARHWLGTDDSAKDVLARLIYGFRLSVSFGIVLTARSLGVSNVTIMRRHVLPNATVAALTFLPFILCGAVTTLTALDFLGFGLPAGSPSLGELLQQGKANLHAPWLGLTGFFTLALMLCLLIFIGEAVRDALDPRRAAQGPPGLTP